MDRNRANSEDWDEVHESVRPVQFPICQCFYSVLGIKTSAQALFDTRVKLRELISMKKQKMNSTEMSYHRAIELLVTCKKKKDRSGAKRAMRGVKSAENRIEIVRKEIEGYEGKLQALDDIRDSKESTDALKEIGRNMRHLNLPKRLQDAEKALDSIGSNAYDMEELQKILQPPPVYGTQAPFSEKELMEEVDRYFAEPEEPTDITTVELTPEVATHTIPKRTKVKSEKRVEPVELR